MKDYQEFLLNFFTDNIKTEEKKTMSLLKKTIDSMTNSDFNEIIDLFQMTKSIKYSGQAFLEAMGELSEDIQKIFYIGYSYATLDSMQLYVEKMQRGNEIKKIKTKYLNDTLYILAKRGMLLHKDLAKALGVSPSGLNAIIKQVNATKVKLINVDEVSKYKIYSLTAIGYNHIVEHDIDNCLSEKKEKPKIKVTYQITNKTNIISNVDEDIVDYRNYTLKRDERTKKKFTDTYRETYGKSRKAANIAMG